MGHKQMGCSQKKKKACSLHEKQCRLVQNEEKKKSNREKTDGA